MSIRAFLGISVFAAAAGLHAQVPPASAKPVEAELLTRVTAQGAQAGDTIYARVVRDWNGPGCRLRRGATLTATVRSAVPRSHSTPSEIALAFDRAECTDAGLEPYQLILESLGSEGDAPGLLSTELPDPSTIGVKTIQLHTAAPGSDMLPDLRATRMRGISGLRLTPGTGSDPVSLVSNRSADVHIEIRSRMLLRPARLLAAPLPAAPDTAAAQVFLERPPVTVLTPETATFDVCAPPACTAAVATTDTDQVYAGSVSLRDLGYVSRPNREIFAPSDDEALAWLSPTQLLVTFNPHTLVPRFAAAGESHCVRIIRAVLIDMAKHATLRTADWQLTDHRQFLWQLPGNRVLVHANNEMRIYSADLQIEQRLRLSGPLGFARVSPDGKLLALGLIRERHTPELHAKLADQFEQDPIEDMQVLLMNNRFETIGSVLANSDRLPPVLLNEGQVSLYLTSAQQGHPRKRYNLQLRNWDHSVQTLAHFESTCAPQVSSLPPDLVFLVTCDKSNGAREYRVLRSDGRPLLHGGSYLRELGHAAGAGGLPGTFAVRIFKTETPALPGEPFHPADLQSAELIIYRCNDGKRLFTFQARDPAASSAGYAVSPSGEVAILTRDEVDVYHAPRK